MLFVYSIAPYTNAKGQNRVQIMMSDFNPGQGKIALLSKRVPEDTKFGSIALKVGMEAQASQFHVGESLPLSFGDIHKDIDGADTTFYELKEDE